jgi:hypothetical protein
MSFLLRSNVCFFFFVKMDRGGVFLLGNPDREVYVCSS